MTIILRSVLTIALRSVLTALIRTLTGHLGILRVAYEDNGLLLFRSFPCRSRRLLLCLCRLCLYGLFFRLSECLTHHLRCRFIDRALCSLGFHALFLQKAQYIFALFI